MKTASALAGLLIWTGAWGPPAQARPERALFVSVIQEPQVLSSRAAVTELVGFARSAGVKTLFVQIYRENKAWFPSRIGDSSPYEACLQSVGEDPFAFLLSEAHAAGLEVHAWLNLLSLGANDRAPLLAKYGTEILTRNRYEKKTLSSYMIDGQFFLEPGDPRVQDELDALLGEVLERYPSLDGVQFDYIRYPDLHPFYGYTRANAERFVRASGLKDWEEDSPKWKDWKRAQVTALVERLSAKARAARPGIRVSTTGLAPHSRAMHEGFQDWRGWIDRGTTDFVTLMCYTKTAKDFERYLSDARRTGGLEKVNFAVGAYALAGKPSVFKRQWKDCEESGGRGCAVFHYGDLTGNPKLAETLKKR